MAFDYEANKDKLFDGFSKPIVTGLFEELHDARGGGKFVLFKLSDWKKKYLEISDPTEYKAAIELIGDWKFWNMMLKNPVFRSVVEGWRKELDVKLESEGIQEIKKQAKQGNTAAAKFLAKKEYKEEGVLKNKPGRPKKEVPAEETANKEAADAATLAADMERLGLKVVTGGK